MERPVSKITLVRQRAFTGEQEHEKRKPRPARIPSGVELGADLIRRRGSR
jgi:hypothetical protein